VALRAAADACARLQVVHVDPSGVQQLAYTWQPRRASVHAAPKGDVAVRPLATPRHHHVDLETVSDDDDYAQSFSSWD